MTHRRHQEDWRPNGAVAVVRSSDALQHNRAMDTPTPAPDLEDKDAPLKADTRLLGRLLGDVIRAQRGDTTFDKVESIRQESVRFHREGATHRTLDALLADLSVEETLDVVRAFTYFSHLANIAEDVQ